MTIKELRELQARIATNARAKLDEINDDTTDERAAEIEAEFDAMMAEHDQIEAKVQREVTLAGAEDRHNAPDPRRPSGPEGEARGGGDEPAPEYAEVFAQALRFGATTLTPEQRSVLMDHQADIPPEVRAQSVGTDTAGGFTVPEEFSNELQRSMLAWGPMFDPGITRELNTSNGRVLKWPTVNDTAKTGRIKAENATVDDDGTDDVVFAEKQFDAYVYDTGMVRMPLELLQDSAFNMESLLGDLFGERMGRIANSVLTTGTGSSQPNGIVTASTLGKTAATNAAITADELIDLQHSVDPAYRGSPMVRWMFNDSTLAAIRKLKDGEGNYLWQMGDVRSSEPSQLLGHPYSVNQAMASIATVAKTVLFGDFSRYIVRKVIGFQVLTLRERYAENFQIGMVGFKRFDGELIDVAAVKHLIQAA